MKVELSLLPFLEPIRPEMNQVELVLLETSTGLEEPFGAALRDVLGGGKRLRPALVVLVGRLFDRPSEPFARLAAAVEVLHTATLVHDDVVDGASMRRGRRALHAAWSPGAAVLAGDYLLAKSTSLIADFEQPCLLKVLAGALGAMSAGEIRQMLSPQGRSGDRESYYTRIEAKTASLCAAATEMAGMLADADGASVAALRSFGRELGLALQIVDDALDFVGSEDRLGKPTGSDLRQGLVTLPLIHFLQTTADEAVMAVLAGQRDEHQVRAAVEAVRSSGAAEGALRDAQLHVSQAKVALSGLPGNDSRHLLSLLADYVLMRDR